MPWERERRGSLPWLPSSQLFSTRQVVLTMSLEWGACGVPLGPKAASVAIRYSRAPYHIDRGEEGGEGGVRRIKKLERYVISHFSLCTETFRSCLPPPRYVHGHERSSPPTPAEVPLIRAYRRRTRGDGATSHRVRTKIDGATRDERARSVGSPSRRQRQRPDGWGGERLGSWARFLSASRTHRCPVAIFVILQLETPVR